MFVCAMPFRAEGLVRSAMVGEMDWNVSGQIAGAHVRLNIKGHSAGLLGAG